MLLPGAWLTWLLYLELDLFHSQLFPLVFLILFFFTSKGIQKWTPTFCFCDLYCGAYNTDTCMRHAAGLSVARWAPLWELQSPTAIAMVPSWSAVARSSGAVAHSQGFYMKAARKTCTASSLWRRSARQKEIPFHCYCHLVVQWGRVVSLGNFLFFFGPLNIATFFLVVFQVMSETEFGVWIWGTGDKNKLEFMAVSLLVVVLNQRVG